MPFRRFNQLFLLYLQASQLISEGNMTAEDFLEANHKLRVQQQVAKEEEEDRADEFEVEELNNLRKASVCFNTFLTVTCAQRDLQSRYFVTTHEDIPILTETQLEYITRMLQKMSR